jgi:hypothetical protein
VRKNKKKIGERERGEEKRGGRGRS